MTAPRSAEVLAADMGKVIAACKKHGKLGVMVGVSEQMLTTCAEMGFSLIVGGGDVQILATVSKSQSAAARQVLAGCSVQAASEEKDTLNSPY